uniref:Uncharacterized protein n=1 Tax=Tanacetum cinerariifolium TaxID=118510 RepID=A0A6L2MWH0_TANCI|nr:hypothetical protein [Tanacetum cinerariifolium]
MATTIEQQVAMDEALVPSTQRLRIGRSNLRLPSDIQSKELTLQLVYDVLRRCPFFKAFLVTADVPEIYMEMLHIYPRIHGQSFDELPFEEEILDFIRDDSIFSTIKVVSKHQNTQQYGAILPIKLTNDKIRITKAYKEYYTFAIGEAAPKPKTSAKRKRSGSDTSITPPTATTTPKTTVAVTPKLNAAVKRKQPTKAKSLSDPSETGGFGTDEGTGLKPGVLDVPTDESEEELSWNSSDDEGADDQVKDGDDGERDEGDESNEGEEDADEDKDGDERDDDGENQKTLKYDEQDDAEGGGDDEVEGESDEEDDNEETREEESFDPIPKTPNGSKDEGNGKEDQGLNVNEEEHVEEEEEDKLYRDVNINQGRRLQATLEVKDTHVTLTPINSDGQQKSSSVSSQFVTSMLNPTSDVGMESIFVTASSSVTPLHTSTPITTPSTIATITTTNQSPIPPTPIPSEVLENLPTFALVFRFDDRLKSLEANFSEYRQTTPFAKAVSNILGIVHQYINQQMNEAVRVAVQIQTDRICDPYQRENDEFLRTIDENMKRIIKEQFKVAADLSEMELKKILIEKMEGNKSIQRSNEQRNLYKALVDTYEADKIILDSYGKTVILKRRREGDDDKDEEPSARSVWGSKRRREGKETESVSALLETTTRSACRSTTGSKSRQASASESAFGKEPVQTTSQIEEPSHPVFETDFSNFIMNRFRVDILTPELLAGPTFELMKGSYTSLIELEYHLEEVYKATTDQLDWVNPEGQQYPYNLLQPILLIPDNQGRRVIPFAHFINNNLEYLRGGAFSRKYTTSVTKIKATDFGQFKWIEYLVPKTMWIQEPIDYDKHALWGVSHWGHKRQQLYGFAIKQEFALNVYSKQRIIAVTDLKIVEWHSYKHLD